MFAPVMEQCFAQVFGWLVKEVTPCLGDDTELLTDLKHAVAVEPCGTAAELSRGPGSAAVQPDFTVGCRVEGVY